MILALVITTKVNLRKAILTDMENIAMLVEITTTVIGSTEKRRDVAILRLTVKFTMANGPIT